MTVRIWLHMELIVTHGRTDSNIGLGKDENKTGVIIPGAKTDLTGWREGTLYENI
jgi:hypothetical protein